ncbi:MAG: GntP family permease [Bacteroidales bacterium]|nr:GntP family permease [Candidatus Cacconaster merdequi]
MTGIALIVTFLLSIVLMIVAISKWKIHPFLSIIGVSLLLAIVAGIPLDSIPSTLGKGFSSIFTSIGIVIILGSLIGSVLERTGAAVRLADSVLKVVGPRHPQLAMMIIGWVVSIPVFCDSGFIIVNPVRKNLAKRTRVSSLTLTLALSAGLFASHVFIPPTPGPIAAAGMLGLDGDLLLVIGMGALVSVFALAAAYAFISFIGKRVKSSEDVSLQETEKDYEKLVASYGKLPSTFLSVLPILLPIVLMGAGSVASVVALPQSVRTVVIFLGKPVISLMAGFLCSLPLLKVSGNMSKLYDITQDTLKTAGPIIFITAAGSVLGQVIVEAGFIQYIQGNAAVLSSVGIFFPFLVAAILKSAQGSSTVAITTTAAIMGMYGSSTSMMYALGMTTPVSAALAVMAIGAGAMTVSHANDSYFWVVTNFGGISPQDGYRTQTAMTLCMGIASILGIFLLSLIMA